MRKIAIAILTLALLFCLAVPSWAKTVIPVEAFTKLSDSNGNITIAKTVTWTGIVTGDTITPWNSAGAYSNYTVYVTGTFANGTTVTFTGTIDGTNYLPLRELYTGASISLTAVPANFLIIPEIVVKMAPTVVSGSADSITVVVFPK